MMTRSSDVTSLLTEFLKKERHMTHFVLYTFSALFCEIMISE